MIKRTGQLHPRAELTAELEALRMRADPLADRTMARIFGAWDGGLGSGPSCCANWDSIGIVNAQIAQWQSNGMLAGWRPDARVPPHIAGPLREFVEAGRHLPEWADPARIERAEALFIDYGMLSCTLLFCSSLPECYVVPDLAAVLQTAGQLEARTDHRIRSTAAMIFPVMMVGGLTRPGGGGVAQVLKVRLIHATIRHLILRGDPGQAVRRGRVPPLPAALPGDLHQALFARGWDLEATGVPCSQDELAYTLLTFGYVALRSLRKLGLGMPRADEEAYLHAWNVMGHVLGMERTLMADTMEQAETLFERLQARGRADSPDPDPRPALGRALMRTMESVIPLRVMRPFPVLLTRFLCGGTTAKNLGIDHRVSWVSRVLFVLFMLLARGIDALGRRFAPGFSIARMVTRVVGYQFTVKVLMDQTRPLKLPPALRDQVDCMTRSWHTDPKAPRWLNKLEHRLSGRTGGPQAPL